MKILLLTNDGPDGGVLYSWFQHRGETVIPYTAPLNTPTLLSFAPDVVVSYGYRHIIPADVLVHMPGRFINMHISLLPYGRGADPCVWSWLESTPAGVTIHEINAGVDTGPIIVQKRLVRKNYGQTLRSEYADLQTELRCLFYQYWPTLLDMPRKPQIGKGTYHNTAQFARLKDELLGPEGWDVQINTLLNRWSALRVANETA